MSLRMAEVEQHERGQGVDGGGARGSAAAEDGDRPENGHAGQGVNGDESGPLGMGDGDVQRRYGGERTGREEKHGQLSPQALSRRADAVRKHGVEAGAAQQRDGEAGDDEAPVGPGEPVAAGKLEDEPGEGRAWAE